MRWWAGVCAIAAVVVLAGCGASTGRGAGAGTGASGSRPARPSGSSGASETPSGPVSPGRTDAPSGGAVTPSGTGSGPSGGCVAGRADVSVAPGDPVRRRLCVRPGTTLTLTLRPRLDDRRWTGVLSSAPALVVASGWRLDADGTAHATLRCAGTRGGTAEVTAAAKAPDIAGAARPVFTLDVDVVPYAQEG